MFAAKKISKKVGFINKKPIKDAIAIIIGKEIKVIRFSLINFVFAL